MACMHDSHLAELGGGRGQSRSSKGEDDLPKDQWLAEGVDHVMLRDSRLDRSSRMWLSVNAPACRATTGKPAPMVP